MLAAGMKCSHCGNPTDKLHQNRPILLRDLPTFGRPVYLQVPRRQFYCSDCQRYSTERLEFCDWERRHTQRYELNIYARVKQSNLEQIGREEGVSYDEIKCIFEHVHELKKNRNGR